MSTNMIEENEVNKYDTSTDERYRVYASISFAILLLGVGVPLWWHTTAVPRVALPYSRIARLSQLDTRIQTKIIVAAITQSRAELLAGQIRQSYENDELYKLDVTSWTIPTDLVSSNFMLHDLEKISTKLNLGVGELLLFEVQNLNEGVLVGSKRIVYFSTETNAAKLTQVLSQWILRNKSLALTKNALAEPTKYSLDQENRRRFPASPAYDILFTVVNPDPEKLKIDWHLPTVIDGYMGLFLNEMSLIANFSVKSQWLYLLPLEVTPKQVPDSSPLGRHYALSEDMLPQLVTPLEKKLASQVSLHPCINLVAYMLPCDKAPLHIYTHNGYRLKATDNVEAFISPRWGGVVLANPPSGICEADEDDKAVTIIPEEATIMGVFLAQLRLLLGIPDTDLISGASVIELNGPQPRDWELDALLRIRAVEQLTSAKLTLQSLAQLLEEISNIVITDVVGNRIKSALDYVERSSEMLERGELKQGFLLSKEAFVAAETAFTDPSLLALLYFPDDQKYAVYIPLFLPVMIPVLLSLKNIRRYFFSNGAEEQKEEDRRKDEKIEDNAKFKTT